NKTIGVQIQNVCGYFKTAIEGCCDILNIKEESQAFEIVNNFLFNRKYCSEAFSDTDINIQQVYKDLRFYTGMDYHIDIESTLMDLKKLWDEKDKCY
ncbi:MAG: hypothetical protein ACK4NF_07385, partial [Planctomycetota bacterium]